MPHPVAVAANTTTPPVQYRTARTNRARTDWIAYLTAAPIHRLPRAARRRLGRLAVLDDRQLTDPVQPRGAIEPDRSLTKIELQNPATPTHDNVPRTQSTNP